MYKPKRKQDIIHIYLDIQILQAHKQCEAGTVTQIKSELVVKMHKNVFQKSRQGLLKLLMFFTEHL